MVCGSVVRQMLAITNAKYGAHPDFTSIAKKCWRNGPAWKCAARPGPPSREAIAMTIGSKDRAKFHWRERWRAPLFPRRSRSF